jgi:ribulose-5-phosphate 4-epimerase/fuculose-1-phosphate aldolase
MDDERITKMEQTIWVARSLFERGKAAGSAANISFRHMDRIYISGSGSCFGNLSRESFAVMDLEGKHMDGPKPSKEFPLHRLLYVHKDVGAVLHTHSFYATLWSCLDHEDGKLQDVIPSHTPYLRMKVGRIGIVPYAPPGSEELFDVFGKCLDKSDGYLLANHGSVIGGKDILEAFYGMEELEEAARIAWYLRKSV